MTKRMAIAVAACALLASCDGRSVQQISPSIDDPVIEFSIPIAASDDGGGVSMQPMDCVPTQYLSMPESMAFLHNRIGNGYGAYSRRMIEAAPEVDQPILNLVADPITRFGADPGDRIQIFRDRMIIDKRETGDLELHPIGLHIAGYYWDSNSTATHDGYDSRIVITAQVVCVFSPQVSRGMRFREANARTTYQ